MTTAVAGTLTNTPHLLKTIDISEANTALELATAVSSRPQRLIAVMVRYSANVTEDVLVTYDAAHGIDYDTLIQTISLTLLSSGSWIPTDRLLIGDGDKILVVAPAGGDGVTAAVTIITELL
jgi:hypothetical protein